MKAMQKLGALRLRAPRGQSMVEYSVITHAILVGGAGLGWPFISQLLQGLSTYYQSIYFVLTSPIP